MRLVHYYHDSGLRWNLSVAPDHNSINALVTVGDYRKELGFFPKNGLSEFAHDFNSFLEGISSEHKFSCAVSEDAKKIEYVFSHDDMNWMLPAERKADLNPSVVSFLGALQEFRNMHFSAVEGQIEVAPAFAFR